MRQQPEERSSLPLTTSEVRLDETSPGAGGWLGHWTARRGGCREAAGPFSIKFTAGKHTSG